MSVIRWLVVQEVCIVHPGIDVHFDVAFLNDHCRRSYMGGTSNFFGLLKTSMASFLTGSFPWKRS